jgi:magnesium-transporting ATPase (P-type)
MNHISSQEAASLSIDQIAKKLHVEPQTGLSQSNANSRLRVFGYNEFNVKDEQSLLSKYVEQVTIRRLIRPDTLNDSLSLPRSIRMVS